MQNQKASCCHTPGIVCGAMQRFHELYPASTALRRGTAFPELDKPSAVAPAPSGCAQPTHHQETAFLACEIRLYLDTHPCDEHALQLYQQLMQKCTHPMQMWQLDDPWPWELCANEGRA